VVIWEVEGESNLYFRFFCLQIRKIDLEPRTKAGLLAKLRKYKYDSTEVKSEL
jgi:hypothetical protein